MSQSMLLKEASFDVCLAGLNDCLDLVTILVRHQPPTTDKSTDIRDQGKEAP